MKDYLERLANEKMAYYHSIYSNSPRWDGKESLENKRIIVYMEQGYGDCIQMARYLKYLKPAYVILHCPHALCSLLGTLADETYPREEEDIPEHDLHFLSLSLPFLVPDPGNDAYLYAPPLEDVSGGIGIAWEGNPNYPKNLERSCPLKYFKYLVTKYPDKRLFSLQIQQNLPELANDCEDLELFGVEMGDFYQTARLIQSMDFIVSVDTSVLHLAGALGKKGIGLLCAEHDKRWIAKKWYSSIEMWRQSVSGDWEGLFQILPEVLL